MAAFRFQYQAYTAPVLVPLSVFGWFNSLSEPVQIEPGLSAAWQQVTSVGTSQVELQTGTYVGIYPLSEPVRVKPPLPEGAKQSFGTDWQWTMAAIPWPAPALSEPVQVKQWLGSAAQQFFAIDAKWDAPAPRMDSWYKLLTEPVRYKIPVAWQQPFTTDWRSVRPSAQDFPNWYSWLSEPVRQKLGLLGGGQQFFAIDTNWNAPAPRADSWFRSLAEPVRYKVPIAYQQEFTFDWQWGPPGVVTDLRAFWYNWLSEPVRTLAALGSPLQQFFAMDWNWNAPAPRTDSWFKSLAEPVRSKQAVAYQWPFTTDWRWTEPAIRFVAGPLSEPVRIAPRVAYQQPFTTDWKWARPSAKFPEWYNRLTEPVRSLPLFRADRQQFYAADWRTPQTTLGSWYKWLSEPVRYRIQSAALQEPFRTDWQWTVPAAVTDLRNFWFSWLTEPVRFKPALWAANQQFFTTDSAWLAPLINYRFAITETRDVAALVYSVIGEPVVGANVTITEIPVGNMANVTISELLP